MSNHRPGTAAPSIISVEEIRAAMQFAPEHKSDEPPTHHTSYRYGLWPANEQTDGRIIAEESVPDQELLTNGGDRDYFAHPSVAIDRYMETSALTHQLSGELGQSMGALGFRAVRYTIDSNNSQLVAVNFPGVERFNAQLESTGLTKVRVAQTPGPTTVEEALAAYATKGELTIPSMDKALMDAPIWGLLPDEAHAALRGKATQALKDGDTREISHLSNILLNGAGLRTHAPKLVDALKDGQIDALGYHFNEMLRSNDGNSDLKDFGRELAEATIKRVYELGGFTVKQINVESDQRD